MILLERIHFRKQRLQVRATEPAQSWEQGLLFISGVFRSRLAKIAQTYRQSSLLLVGERATLRVVGDRKQCVEKTFDAPVTVSEHPDRIHEVTFSLCTDHDWHGCPPIRYSESLRGIWIGIGFLLVRPPGQATEILLNCNLQSTLLRIETNFVRRGPNRHLLGGNTDCD